jgi:toxin ParE1/3/4
MIHLIFHPEAEEELFSSIAFYNQQSSGLGIEFLEEIERCFNLIRDNPKRWKILKKGIRQYIVRRFPYLIFYIYDRNQVFIVAIAHNCRKPDYWKERIPIK